MQIQPDRKQSRQLRVLMYLYFPGGGIGRYTARLMPELSALGAHVEAVVVPEFQWKDMPGYHTWPGLKSISHSNTLRRKARFLTRQFSNPRRLAARVKEVQPDIVHICSINHLSYPTWAHLFPSNGPKIAVSVHDVRRQKGILCKPWERWQLQRFYRRADLLFVHSVQQKQDLMAFADVAGNKIFVVPHGPYEYPQATESRVQTRQRLQVPDTANLGLAFGLIRDEKNLDNLIVSLKQTRNDTHLLIAGSDVGGHKPLRHYQSLATREGLNDRVHFMSGYIPDEDIGNLFKSSDWLALTYSMSFTSQSGVLSSAVNYDLPVLATPTATFAEILDEYQIGALCSDDSCDAISAGIKELRSHNRKAFQFEAYLNGNSWERNAAITVRAYESILQ